MRQQFRNLDTWRGKMTAAWVCLAPPTAMVVVFVAGGVTSNTFIVDAHALSQPRQDSVFDELAEDLPASPGVDGSVATEQKSQIQVPVTGALDSSQQPGTGTPGDTSGIAGTVLAAYQKAANDLALAQPNCGITWPLLAGIGKVESAHASGGRVDAAGVTRGKILGPVLDGGPGMAAISDTDQGAYDGDTKWDRAVGPMQFIPGTWKAFGADGNGDGVKDPHNIFDAARAAGDYLCSGGANLKGAPSAEKISGFPIMRPRRTSKTPSRSRCRSERSSFERGASISSIKRILSSRRGKYGVPAAATSVLRLAMMSGAVATPGFKLRQPGLGTNSRALDFHSSFAHERLWTLQCRGGTSSRRSLEVELTAHQKLSHVSGRVSGHSPNEGATAGP